ncbi:MAG: biopolymer transporter ExbD [Planctomycetales bacterium]|nr:biopolymer transporter ExbD [Planctomycetales bacterium]MCA9171984.1 biopolymer transporter ExbD [Planctomycetales bacterium]
MRIPTSQNRSTGRPDAAMTPMIDVVFLLLIFFVVTASFQRMEQLLPSELTAPSGAGVAADLREEDFEKIVIRLQRAGQGIAWTLNGQAVDSPAQLDARLKTLASIRAELPVVIHPDPDVQLGDVVDVYDVAREVGLANIQFTTR